MSDDQLQSHLDRGRYGSPLVNPDEQHQYMGTFRERCLLSMTVAEMKKRENQTRFVQELKKYPGMTVLLNGKLPDQLQTMYIQLATQNNMKFTVINDFVTNEPTSLGLLLTAKEAVNEAVIDIEEKYATPESTEAKEPTEEDKKGFWHKLFH
ncbi:hypothetical protein IGI37_000387 [Enterococcus sp. AZ194]|uniref:YueI family protein n=1 Tax=Enterococcus sp. AZ194 TaxID=2774629 RepID=UPI003F20B5C1